MAGPLLLLLVGQELDDLLARLFERHRGRRLSVRHLDDVIAELRGDDVADLAGLQRERRLRKAGTISRSGK